MATFQVKKQPLVDTVFVKKTKENYKKKVEPARKFRNGKMGWVLLGIPRLDVPGVSRGFCKKKQPVHRAIAEVVRCPSFC